MTTQRYTVKSLKADIAQINWTLKAAYTSCNVPESRQRFLEHQGRNGYQAIDVVNAQGGILSTLSCGTSQQVSRDAAQWAIQSVGYLLANS